MGIFSWFSRGSNNNKKENAPVKNSGPKPEYVSSEAPGMNGAMEVRRAAFSADLLVFEFRSVASSANKVTVTGYCPVSDELEPCRWEILPTSGLDAPQFRVVF